jgi:hypothetical protein
MDAHPTQVLRFVGVSYPDWYYFDWQAIPITTFSQPLAVLESNPRGTFLHLNDAWLGVTGALWEDPNDTVGKHPDEAVQ